MVDANKDLRDRFMMSFLCAGSSALLISAAQLHPEYWFVSLVALIPFLWRVTRASLHESVVLGAVLATSYCLVTVNAAAWGGLGAFLLRLLVLNALFALYGILVNTIASRIGFNAVFTAVFWLPIEYALSRCAHLGGVFSTPEANSSLLVGIGSLFGVLVVSFLVVLVNSLILIVTESLVRALWSRTAFPRTSSADERFYLTFSQWITEKHWYSPIAARAPPV
jgi:apolipoprotein N-acyltransferase